jgi:hypothetical protein
MADISNIPEEELRKDLQDSYADIIACEAAMRIGVETYSGGSVQKRLNANRGFIKVIEAELARRGKSAVVAMNYTPGEAL